MVALTRLGTWLKDHVDLALVLAAATEIPRWTVAFLAINEPLWVGVPLGALLAWALKAGWNDYFRTRRLGILALNLAALATAICVITPVLYVMTYVPVEKVNLTLVFGDSMAYRMAWAGLLALSTFLPLIQLSAVRPVISTVAQNVPVAPIVPPTPDILPHVTKRAVMPAVTPDSVTADLEDMLAGVSFEGHGMAQAWESAYASSGKIGIADKRVAQEFGISQRTVTRRRLADWQEVA